MNEFSNSLLNQLINLFFISKLFDELKNLAPVAVANVPVLSSYSSSVNHATPVLSAPLGHGLGLAAKGLY